MKIYLLLIIQFSSAQLLSRVRLFATPWIAARQASLSITNSRSSLKLTSIESVMPSSHLILCHRLFLLPPIPPSIRVFSNESTLRIIREMQIKTTMWYHCSPIRMAKIWKSDHTMCWWNLEELELIYCWLECYNFGKHYNFGKQFGISLNF